MSAIPTTAQAWRFPPDKRAGTATRASSSVKYVARSGQLASLLIELTLTGTFSLAGAISWAILYRPDGQGLIPSCDGAGEVVAVGEGVTQWKKGDECTRCSSKRGLMVLFKTSIRSLQLVVAPPDASLNTECSMLKTLLPIPAHLSYEEAATIPCAALTAWHSSPRRRGTGDLLTTSSKEKAAKYKDLGVDEIINYREVPEWSSKVKDLTGGKGVEQVLEVGGQGTLMQSLKSIKREGFVHVIGVVAQE
ncbi:Zinc-binding dehydrogenase [Rhizoctonia solani]|uniref:Zinc-binding dehydrogenase n=1 Tax=Rhizoctonia solani TaxID=456999 RepID=A0A8H7IN41_9AGAM|nr:Zinc-binding dehydrogenase [Rhizoctonia solani]